MESSRSVVAPHYFRALLVRLYLVCPRDCQWCGPVNNGFRTVTGRKLSANRWMGCWLHKSPCFWKAWNTNWTSIERKTSDKWRPIGEANQNSWPVSDATPSRPFFGVVDINLFSSLRSTNDTYLFFLLMTLSCLNEWSNFMFCFNLASIKHSFIFK